MCVCVIYLAEGMDMSSEYGFCWRKVAFSKYKTFLLHIMFTVQIYVQDFLGIL